MECYGAFWHPLRCCWVTALVSLFLRTAERFSHTTPDHLCRRRLSENVHWPKTNISSCSIRWEVWAGRQTILVALPLKKSTTSLATWVPHLCRNILGRGTLTQCSGPGHFRKSCPNTSSWIHHLERLCTHSVLGWDGMAFGIINSLSAPMLTQQCTVMCSLVITCMIPSPWDRVSSQFTTKSHQTPKTYQTPPLPGCMSLRGVPWWKRARHESPSSSGLSLQVSAVLAVGG